MAVRSTQHGSCPPSTEGSIGARRAQVNAYRDAVNASPLSTTHGDRPPETYPPGPVSADATDPSIP
jgi:hypothetical protein